MLTTEVAFLLPTKGAGPGNQSLGKSTLLLGKGLWAPASRTSLTTAPADVDCESGILLPAEGPAMVGQRKSQRQYLLDRLSFLFPKAGAMAHCSWHKSENLLFLLIPAGGSCVTPISLQHVTCSFVGTVHCSRPFHVFTTNQHTRDYQWLHTRLALSTAALDPFPLTPLPIRGK